MKEKNPHHQRVLRMSSMIHQNLKLMIAATFNWPLYWCLCLIHILIQIVCERVFPGANFRNIHVTNLCDVFEMNDGCLRQVFISDSCCNIPDARSLWKLYLCQDLCLFACAKNISIFSKNSPMTQIPGD